MGWPPVWAVRRAGVRNSGRRDGDVVRPDPTDPSTPDAVESDPARVQERMRGVADLGRDWDVLHTTLYRVHQRVADAYVETKALLALIQGTGTVEQLDEACDARREVALSYVKTITHDNWEKLRQDDPEAIKAYHDELRELAADRERMRKHLLNTSMINSLRGVGVRQTLVLLEIVGTADLLAAKTAQELLDLLARFHVTRC